jgi:formamidopyrimidine-DNA glycosylase
MPELPDVEVYVEKLRERLAGRRLKRILIRTPFLLRSTAPPIQALDGRAVREIRRVGKRIAIGFDHDLWLVLHLMIAGRLHWKAAAPKLSPKGPLAVFEFDGGALTLTEAGSQHRAALHVLAGEEGLRAFDAGGIEVLDAGLEEFSGALTASNHTLKRALTDPRTFSGIGNAYSDEILHAAKLSPLRLTSQLSDEGVARLHRATQETLRRWITRLQDETGNEFPEHVTAFREGMAVHGRYRQPCPVCGAPVQRIRYAENEVNYCATCQTEGRVLADRSMSRLLREDWPRSLDEWEEKLGGKRVDG